MLSTRRGVSMRHIRVIVAGMSTFHADIVRRIVDEQLDMSVVAEVEAGGPIREAVERADADVVVFGAPRPDPRCPYLELVWEHPWLRVLALDTTGRQHSPVEVRLRGSAEETWPVALIEAMRRDNGPDNGPVAPGGGAR